MSTDILMKDCWICKTWEYQIVYKEGTKRVGKGLIVYVYCHGGEKARFGIAVTKRTGKAVVRNRIKRRLREIIRKHLKERNGGYSMVIVARNSIIYSTFQEIEKELFSIIKKIKKDRFCQPCRAERTDNVL